MNKEEEASRWPRVQEAVIDIGTMTPVRICPRKALLSLSHLRIDRARIMPIEGQAPKEGGKADVEAAILAPAQVSNSAESNKAPNSLEFGITEYVAVKKLRFDMETGDARALAPFAHEVGLMNDLSHKNVVKIIGFVEDVDNGVAWMVFRWEKNGNLREFVRSENWELPERVCLINDVASGIRYLHERNPPICHGDLKSLNILVNSKNRAIITDFGSAHAIDSAKEAALSGVNTAIVAKIKSRTLTGVRDSEPLKADIAESGEFITMTGPAWTIRWAALSCWMEIFPVWGVISGLLGGFVGRPSQATYHLMVKMTQKPLCES